MLIILDVDGVLTNGTKVYDYTGKCISKSFCDRDFTVIKQLRADGHTVVFLSGDRTVNEAVARNRGIPFYCNRDKDNFRDKSEIIPELAAKYKTDLLNTVYVGDDIFDLKAMLCVGIAFYPKNAAPILKKTLNFVKLKSNGGDNVLTDMYEYLLKRSLVNYKNAEDINELDKNEIF